MKNVPLANYSRFDLRQLWPIVSGTLYPETASHIAATVNGIRVVRPDESDSEYFTALLDALDEVSGRLKAHSQLVEEVITVRLSVTPYGQGAIPDAYFIDACEKHSESAREIKTEWTYIQALAKRCFGKENNSAEQKLAVARLNGLEQDILYVLFVEHQYLCPLILKKTG